MIDRSTIDRIMASADIVDVVKEFVTLRKSGANYKGLCPFHDEKTPSFMVSPSKQLCKCFSCGKGGNVTKFLMEHEQISYPEALRWLGRKYGIEIQEKELTPEQRAASTERESMFVVNEWARDFFVKTLRESVDGMAIGMTYFRRRGLRDDIIRKFQLGFSPESRDSLAVAAHKAGHSDKFLESTGLCYRTTDGKLLDRYHGRVIFPVHNVSGRVVAFGGRTLLSKEEQKARSIGKYVNSPESQIYSKKRELYGLYQAKSAIAKQDRVFLVEGYLDVISMHQSGIENVVASSGTSLTSEQVRLIHRFTNNVTVLYDGDAAGIHAARRGVDMLLSEGLNIKVLLLPDGEDPDSFAQGHTPEELRRYIDEHQTDFIRFKTNLLLADSKGDPARRATVIKDVVSSVALIPDNIVRQTYTHEVAGQLGIDENTIVNEITILRKRQRDAVREDQARAAAREAGTAPRESAVTGSGNPMGADALAMEPVIAPDGTLIEGPASISESDVARYSTKSHGEKLVEACENKLVELVIRFGGLPIVLQPEKVERKFGGDNKEGRKENVTEDGEKAEVRKRRVFIEDPDTPLVAPYVYDSLRMDELSFHNPLYTAIVQEAVKLAEENYSIRKSALDAGVSHADAPSFFDALNYFRMHSDNRIAQLADSLTDDRYILSSSQIKMYTPDERRLVEIVPRVVNDYKHAILALEKEQLAAQLRLPEVLADEKRLRDVMSRLAELQQIESEFARQLGGRVIVR